MLEETEILWPVSLEERKKRKTKTIINNRKKNQYKNNNDFSQIFLGKYATH